MLLRGGLAVELGPGRFGSEGARNYSSESFTGHSFGRTFADHCLNWLQMILDSLFTIEWFSVRAEPCYLPSQVMFDRVTMTKYRLKRG